MLVQAIFTELDFYRPFFLTYVANSLFVVLLPVRAVRRALMPPQQDAPGSATALTPALALVCPLWFAANLLYNISLGLTSLTSSTVIAASSSTFTLLLSLCWLGERFAWLKLAGVALCWVGNALTTFQDSSAAASTAGNGWGDTLCLGSAVLYALYTCAIRRYEPPDLLLFFGSLGLLNLLCLAPVALALHLSHTEDLSTLTPRIAALLVTKGLSDNVLSDYCWAQAVLLTSPSVATVGLSLTIPLAIMSQLVLPSRWLVDATPPTPFSMLGALFVLAGFVAINLAGAEPGARAGMQWLLPSWLRRWIPAWLPNCVRCRSEACARRSPLLLASERCHQDQAPALPSEAFVADPGGSRSGRQVEAD